MSFERLQREKRELERTMQESSNKIYGQNGVKRKAVNGYEWNTRIECVERLKKVNQQMSQEAKEIASRGRRY